MLLVLFKFGPISKFRQFKIKVFGDAHSKRLCKILMKYKKRSDTAVVRFMYKYN